MGTVTFMYTRRRWNLISLAIRWAMPRSRFAFALSSHLIVLVGDACYEATMLHGVRKVPLAEAMAGQILVKESCFFVPDPEAGIAFGEAQLCRYEPKLPAWLPNWIAIPARTVLKICHNNYDFKGAFGLSLAPDRDWAEADFWFCYEFGAAWLRAAGRNVFANLSHIGETALMAINTESTHSFTTP